MKKLQQFKIYAFTYERISNSNFNITTTPFEAELKEEVISLGDNECLRAIRRITNHPFSDFRLAELAEEKKIILKKRNSTENKKKIKDINNEIRRLLFIPEIISVSTKRNKSYLKLGKNGFYVNGIHYIRFMCGAGHARTNRAMYCDEKIFNQLVSILRNGCADIPIVGAKYNAYFSLSGSATYRVSSPRFCVVPDKEIKMVKSVDWVEEEGEDDIISRQDKELTFNLWDGMGIISPEFAKIWANELEIDYLPSAFVCRAPFTKGLVCTFDFKDFSEKVAQSKKIIDIYGKEWNCDDLDIILTESQFKYAKAFESIEQFNKNMEKNELKWGVSKVSPKNEDLVKMSNYQFLQVLNCNDEDIKNLCSYTLEWIKSVSCKDYERTLLYLLGKLVKKYSAINIFDKIGDGFIKALIINPELIGDSYIIDRIYHSLEKRKKESCMGKLIFNGNFQFLIMDPYALCEHRFGLEVKGLLKEFEHYSKYWLDKGEKQVCALRSPMTWRSEVNLLNLKDNEEVNYWYKYLQSGIILNVWGYDNMLFAGSDADGDTLFTTNDKTYLKCRYGGVPVAYQPKKAEKVNIDLSSLYNLDVLGFNTKIGFITNCSTTLYEMQTMYEPGSKEYNEIENRLKLCCKYQSHEIDHAKGIQTKPFPKHFTTFDKIKETDSEEEKQLKLFNNKLVIEKRTYFMRHRYPQYNQEYKNHIADFDRYCLTKYNCKYKELPEDFKKTEEYKELKKYYDYRNPLLETNGTMNRICYYMENELKNIKQRNHRVSNDILYKILNNENILIDSSKLSLLNEVYEEYVSFKRDKMLSNSDFATYEQFYKYLRNKSLENISNNIQELANLSVYLCYKLKKNKDFCWEILGTGIVSNLIENKINSGDSNVMLPQSYKDGEIEYLGENFTMLPYNLETQDSNLDIDDEELFNFNLFDDIDSDNLGVQNDSF